MVMARVLFVTPLQQPAMRSIVPEPGATLGDVARSWYGSEWRHVADAVGSGYSDAGSYRICSGRETKTMTISAVSKRLFTQGMIAAALVPAHAWAAPWPSVTVHKDPNCGCCGGWVAHIESNGFTVRVVDSNELDHVKSRLGVPSDLAACHTAEADGYVLEGHVPAAAVQRFLTERPQARGLAVPGMPSGSPGMTGDYEEYDVILFGPNERRVYARFKGDRQI
jgi:hypothetical protein